jgi:ribosomal protein L23
MDYNKLRVYGFPRHVMNYNVYNPTKIRYLKSRDYGYFEAPKKLRNPELRYLVDRYKQRLEYEKYMNPKGIKTTWTSNFTKIGNTIDYANPNIFLTRSGKRYEDNEIKFHVDKRLSKYEIIQFLEKLYKFKVKKIHTAILPGEVKLKRTEKQIKSYMRTRDRKRAVVQLDFNVDEKYRKLILEKQ